MKRLYLLASTSALSLFVVHAAVAADLPVKAPAFTPMPVYNWSGFYVGGLAGYGWGTNDWTRIAGSSAGSANGSVRSFDSDGAVVGGQLGFNYQIQQWVLGIEGEMAWSDVKGGFSGSNNNGPASWNTDNKWIATLAGRVGYAFDNVLLYGKGGVAWVNSDYSHPATSGPGAGNIALNYTGSDTRTGWLLGVGVEYGFAPNWSAKLEYDYMDFGSKDITLNDSTGRWVTFGIDQKENIVKVGLNYRFGGSNW